MTKETQQQIAQTIAQQIGNRKLYSLGAKYLVAITEGGLTFNVKTPAGNKINKVAVYLTPADEYRVEFWNINMNARNPAQKIEEIDGIYFDSLGDIILKTCGVEEIPAIRVRRLRTGRTTRA